MFKKLRLWIMVAFMVVGFGSKALAAPAAVATAVPAPAYTYPIDQIQIDPTRADFVVGPGKTDLVLNPGETKTIELTVSNRTGKDRNFEIKFSDFTGSNDLASPVVLTTETGANTMMDFVSVPKSKFFLGNGERARIPVKISVPAGAEPGGRYVSILVSTLTPLDTSSAEDATKGGVPLITQTGTLVFVTVPGEIKQEGSLTDFYTLNKQTFFSYGKDVNFDLVFQNTGKIHLNPSGTITVKNIFNQDVRVIDLEPWFAMPNALRLREVGLVNDVKKDNIFMMGRYVAEAKIYRGYGDKYDTKTLAFWVIPWKLLIFVFLALVLLLWLIRSGLKYLTSHFKIQSVSSDVPTPTTPTAPSAPAGNNEKKPE